MNGGDARWITTDFFDSDTEGRIVEHWDVIDADHGLNLAGRSQVDGASDVIDLDKTEENKAIVQAFVETVLISRDLGWSDEFLHSDLAQHAPGMSDGSAAFKEFYSAADCALSYQECFMIVAEGNFVATLNRARWNDDDLCRVDLFRLANGFIVEHWVNSEPVPPKDQWTNSGKF